MVKLVSFISLRWGGRSTGRNPCLLGVSEGPGRPAVAAVFCFSARGRAPDWAVSYHKPVESFWG